MKKIYTIFLLILLVVLFIWLLFYGGILNPRTLIVDDIKIKTPKNYTLIMGSKNFQPIDIKCKSGIWCTKKIIIDKSVRLVMFDYYEILSLKKLRIAIRKIPRNKDNNIVYTSKNVLKKNSNCSFEYNFKNGIYEYHIYKSSREFIYRIDILSSNNDIAKKMFNEICCSSLPR